MPPSRHRSCSHHHRRSGSHRHRRATAVAICSLPGNTVAIANRACDRQRSNSKVNHELRCSEIMVEVIGTTILLRRLVGSYLLRKRDLTRQQELRSNLHWQPKHVVFSGDDLHCSVAILVPIMGPRNVPTARKLSYCGYKTPRSKCKSTPIGDQSEDHRVDDRERGAMKSVLLHAITLLIDDTQGTTSTISNSIAVIAPNSIPSTLVTSTGVSIPILPTYTVPPGTVLPQPFFGLKCSTYSKPSLCGTAMPSKFRTPNFSKFDGTIDPHEHIFQYTSMPKELRDAIMCKLFLQSLKSKAIKWFCQLDPSSADYFKKLTKTFMEKYSVNIYTGTTHEELF
ncbi:hypothetical protein TIFTF001_032906 [Ficus carica]|uniref:Retrotransposon gag domain-containing protein n=1 Tax=Ficus carica TaxID=3494 RepID=A0AA88E109_FICCA|nr:hypothetical protein TIFTF001_032906 [Ficus carica]